MTTNICHQEKPWQNTTFGSRNKLKAIYNEGYLSDLTITFPGTDIKYKAHKVVLAMSSSNFEGMLFGPMAITGSELELPDDNPEAFKIVLAHCYDVTMEPTDLDVALDVYMLADKYYLEQLVENCRSYIVRMVNSDTIYKILEFATNFNFDSVKFACFAFLGSRFEYAVCDSSKALLILREEWLEEFLEFDNDISIQKLVFDESWEIPDEVLCDDTILKVLKSESCEYNLRVIAGCVSAKVVNYFLEAFFENDIQYVKSLCVSFNNLQQANEIIHILEKVTYPLLNSIHLQGRKIPADQLCQLHLKDNFASLFLSDVDDDGIDWVVSVIRSLNPRCGRISFPRSKLTFNGLKSLLPQLASVFDDVRLPLIQICSLEIPVTQRREVCKYFMMIKVIIVIYDCNEKILGWKKLHK